MRKCANCGHRTGPDIWETRDGRVLCPECARHLNYCEICGSTRTANQTNDEQLHFEEECFK